MPTLFGMPKLGMNMVKGTIVQWLAAEGDMVEEGWPLLEVETDKVVQEIEAPVTGVLAKIVRQEGEEVPCTHVIAVLTDAGEPLPEQIPETVPGSVRPKAEVEVVVSSGSEDTPGEAAAEPQPKKRVAASPVAKKLAQQLGVDIATVVPSGRRISRADVEAAYEKQQRLGAAAPGPEAAGEEVGESELLPLDSVRRTISTRMDRSARSVARVGLSLEADAGNLIAWREELRATGRPIGYNELLVKLVAQALTEFPYMNVQWTAEGIRQMWRVNIGIATETERGLLVPVIRDVQAKSALEIAAEFGTLLDRARAGKSTLDDLSGGTFTISNLGMYEVEEFLPIINLPESAILGVGAIIRKPVAVGERVEIHPRLTVTLSFDHRVVDGGPAARFLQRVKQLIEDPVGL